MTTLLDIIDTTVKIGLGALISGITTYLVTRKAHSHERSADLIQYKRNVLLEISQLIDDAGNIRNEAKHLRNEMIDLNDFTNEEKCSEIGNKYLLAANLIKGAVTKCYLINDLELAKIAKEYFAVIGKLYLLAQNSDLDHADEYDMLNDLCDSAKLAMLNKYSISLERIYA